MPNFSVAADCRREYPLGTSPGETEAEQSPQEIISSVDWPCPLASNANSEAVPIADEYFRAPKAN